MQELCESSSKKFCVWDLIYIYMTYKLFLVILFFANSHKFKRGVGHVCVCVCVCLCIYHTSLFSWLFVVFVVVVVNFFSSCYYYYYWSSSIWTEIFFCYLLTKFFITLTNPQIFIFIYPTVTPPPPPSPHTPFYFLGIGCDVSINWLGGGVNAISETNSYYLYFLLFFIFVVPPLPYYIITPHCLYEDIYIYKPNLNLKDIVSWKVLTLPYLRKYTKDKHKNRNITSLWMLYI